MSRLYRSAQALLNLVAGAMKFRDFRSHGGTSKMWIDPKNRPIPLDGMHYEWLRENAPFVRKAYNLPDMPDWGYDDEGKARLWALSNGFTRVNFKNNWVTFETNERFWTKKRQDVISMLVAENSDDIDNIVVNVLNDSGKLIKDGRADVSGLDEAVAKVESIPVIPAKQTRLIAEVLRRVRVEASSLTRILRLIGKPDQDGIEVLRPFGIVTAFQTGVSLEVNNQRLNQMSEKLGRSGVKTYRLQGNWLEQGLSPDEAKKPVKVREDALFCVVQSDDDIDFEAFSQAIIRQADRFNQAAVILSDGANIWLRFKDGHTKDFGDTADVATLQQAYQQMRAQQEHTFTFE
jgi:hypothetical protein